MVAPSSAPDAPRDVAVSPSEPKAAAASPEVFRRGHRLHKPTQFAAVFAARRVLPGEIFTLHYRANGSSGARLGLVIPKKQARCAVLRNTIKRHVRETFRRCRADLPKVDVVIRLARPIDTRDEPAREAWRRDLADLFARLVQRTKGGM